MSVFYSVHPAIIFILQAVYFSLSYKSFDSEAGLSEVLIPECKCNSHKQVVSGEMISLNTGLYIFYFSINSYK